MPAKKVNKDKKKAKVTKVVSVNDGKVSVKNQPLQQAHDELFKLLQARLATQRQLKEGGGFTRTKHARERDYLPLLDELNDIRRVLDLPIIVGFGHMRRP